MKKKIINISLIITLMIMMLVILTGCGSEDSKENSKEISKDSIEFDYSKINTDSENVGKSVDVQTFLNEDINPETYEGVAFTGDTGSLSESDVKTANINWVILAEDDENYMLTTVKATTDTFELKGADGYNNGVQAINAYCARFYSIEVNGNKYAARSINMNDIEAYYEDKTDTWKQETLGFTTYNTIGMEGQNYKYYPSLYALESGSNMGGNLELSETPNGYEPYNDSYKNDATSTANYLDTYYSAKKTELKDNFSNGKACDIIFLDSGSYWVATRCVQFYDSKMSSSEISKGERRTPGAAQFCMRMIDANGLSAKSLLSSSNYDHSNLISARPVVVVPKSEIGL